MGVARLSKVTVISPRSEYDQVAKALAQFENFHPIEEPAPKFDPGVQDLAVRAVRLFAQADQASKDLGLQLMPGQMDIVFRGAKVPRSDIEASDWGDLLAKAAGQVGPMAEKVRSQKARLQMAQKDQADATALADALRVVSGFSSDIGGLSALKRFKATVLVVPGDRVSEFRNSVPDGFVFAQPVSKESALVLAAVRKEDETKLDKAIKLLELKTLFIPSGLPQNPAEAFKTANVARESAAKEIEKVEAEMAEEREKDGPALLAIRELAEAARKMLDEVRVSGGMMRLATISGYIPAREEPKFRGMFGRWIVHFEPVDPLEEEGAPTLMVNRRGLGMFQPVTKEQGIPGGPEVDPTPLVSFVFPIFFGLMFGDVGHGLILTLFMLLVRQRSTGNMRQWANIFVVSGVSATVFGVVFGEFFEQSFSNFVPIPPAVEIIHRAAGSQDTFAISGVYLVMEVAILIGVLHLVTALSLDIYEGAREEDRLELWLEKIPVLTMYLAGVGYGLAFVGVGFSFNVLSSSAPAPLIGIPNDVLGAASLAVLVPSMLVLLAGKAFAIKAGRMKGSFLGALSNGGLEVFERISQFMSNTISYVRLAVMLLVHAALLLIINLLQPWTNPVMIAPWVVLNLLIISFEAFIVYVQDLRLHLYEFFTKFFLGSGTPFRKILPERARIRIKWT